MRAVPAALVLFALATTSPAEAADPDPWFARDKALHFGVSAGIAAGSYAVSAAVLDARAHALLLAGGITVAAGVGKEALDLAGYGDPSWKDLAWDGAGMLVGLAMAWGLDLLLRGVSDRHPALGEPRAAEAPSASAPTALVISF